MWTNFIKGMGTGLVVGACIGMTCAPDKKKGKKMLGKAMRAVSEVMDDVASVMGL